MSCLFCDSKIAPTVSINFGMCFSKTSDVPEHKHSCDIICGTCSEQIHESGCQVSSAIPAESNSKSRLKPCARIGDAYGLH